MLLFYKVQTDIEAKSGDKTFLFHSYSTVFDSYSNGQKLLKLFSSTSDGKMLKIVGNFNSPVLNLKMNVDASSYRMVSGKNESSSMDKQCNLVAVLRFYTIVLITDDAKSSILLYGCDINSTDLIRIHFIERQWYNGSEEFLDSGVGVKSFIEFDNETNFGHCACNKRLEQLKNVEEEGKAFEVVFYGLIGVAVIFVAVSTVYSLCRKKKPVAVSAMNPNTVK